MDWRAGGEVAFLMNHGVHGKHGKKPKSERVIEPRRSRRTRRRRIIEPRRSRRTRRRRWVAYFGLFSDFAFRSCVGRNGGFDPPGDPTPSHRLVRHSDAENCGKTCACRLAHWLRCTADQWISLPQEECQIAGLAGFSAWNCDSSGGSNARCSWQERPADSGTGFLCFATQWAACVIPRPRDFACTSAARSGS